MKVKGGNAGNGVIPTMNKYSKSQVEGIATASSNPFVVLSSADEHNSHILKEGAVQQSEVHKEEGEVNRGPQETEPIFVETPSVDAIMQDISPIRTTTSPSYAYALKKKLVETSGSSDNNEQFTKKARRKSRKRIREEEAERINMQGI